MRKKLNSLRFLIPVLLAFLCNIQLWAQNNTLEKVTLRSGEVYVGEILLKNQDIVMIQTTAGAKFQFPAADVKSIETVSSNHLKNTQSENEANSPEAIPEGNISALIELSGGIAHADNKTDLAPAMQGTLSFGTRLLKGKNLFLGIGTGYFCVVTENENVGFIPLFLRLRGTLTQKRVSPFASIDAGYASSLTENYEGGIYSRLTLGIQKKLHEKSVISAGIYAGAFNFSTDLTETNETGTFSYHGGTDMINAGITLGLQF